MEIIATDGITVDPVGEGGLLGLPSILGMNGMLRLFWNFALSLRFLLALRKRLPLRTDVRARNGEISSSISSPAVSVVVGLEILPISKRPFAFSAFLLYIESFEDLNRGSLECGDKGDNVEGDVVL